MCLWIWSWRSLIFSCPPSTRPDWDIWDVRETLRKGFNATRPLVYIGSSEKGRTRVKHFKSENTDWHLYLEQVAQTTLLSLFLDHLVLSTERIREDVPPGQVHILSCNHNLQDLISKSLKRTLLRMTIYAISHSLVTNNSRFSKNRELEETEPENTTGSQLLV